MQKKVKALSITSAVLFLLLGIAVTLAAFTIQKNLTLKNEKTNSIKEHFNGTGTLPI